MAVGVRDWLSAWDEFRIEAEEYQELDGERVLVLARRGGRGKVSGIDLEQMQVMSARVFHVQDGKVTRLVVYHDHANALADLGLDE
jgi:ketosteroid isomerase-like protein